MQPLLITGALLLGAIAGSFLNALSFRWGTSVSVAHGRSRCMRCGTTLGVLDLIPVVSWLALRGRCRFCGSGIAVQYPLVEAAAALLSLSVYLLYPQPLAFAYWFAVWMTLLFVVVYDVRHQVIPWSCSAVLAVLGLAYVWSVGFGTSAGMWSLAAGPLLAAPLALLWLVSGGRWMGFGDGVLELSLGWFLGISAGLTALLLAFWAGALVGIVALTLQRGVTIKSEVPFAPFLVLGATAAFFGHVDFFPTLPLLFS